MGRSTFSSASRKGAAWSYGRKFVMEIVLVFALTLFVAACLSERAQRTVLSTAVLFLVVGFAIGDGALGLTSIEHHAPIEAELARLALFSVLLTDGMHCPAGELRSAWRLPGRALFLGLPLGLLTTALVARVLTGLPWPEAFLLGAALSPTDPVFASAIVGREGIPARLRHLLNVESGLNDGFALPLVIVLLELIGPDPLQPYELLREMAVGVALGVSVSWVGTRIIGLPVFKPARLYEPFDVFAVGLALLALTSLFSANEYLAAFSAGVTIATLDPVAPERFRPFGGHVTELLKLAALLLFGALTSRDLFAHLGWLEGLFTFLVLFLVRPAALSLALLGSSMPARERVAAAWFGPKGFASVSLGLLILKSAVPHSGEVFHLLALVVIGSIVAHSSTDVPVARWLRAKDVSG